ncbi:hypothetical protein BDQ17DRAFT_1329457 [Cyathus striatus]|nr:hypothetical protein BDQ17DRAFT_1329457 [Cyathus striatus]
MTQWMGIVSGHTGTLPALRYCKELNSCLSTHSYRRTGRPHLLSIGQAANRLGYELCRVECSGLGGNLYSETRSNVHASWWVIQQDVPDNNLSVRREKLLEMSLDLLSQEKPEKGEIFAQYEPVINTNY